MHLQRHEDPDECVHRLARLGPSRHLALRCQLFVEGFDGFFGVVSVLCESRLFAAEINAVFDCAALGHLTKTSDYLISLVDEACELPQLLVPDFKLLVLGVAFQEHDELAYNADFGVIEFLALKSPQELSHFSHKFPDVLLVEVVAHTVEFVLEAI